ncbi:putative PB1 domain, tetratricopeptide-like helical domain superfamily, protein PHOX1-4 [Helianthus annuus]|nr:putative PB1 domain, tetratricopeptide-like helical domain superfamily, protein PHOX1-4 [Helianthus annuus]
MGKSGGRKKKSGGGGSQNQSQNPSQTGGHVSGRANELKEEGNKRFQARDFVGALEQYENALKLTPKNHPDRAIYHSNRAACLMQMKPIDYKMVVSECSMALQVQPGYVRALLRRARAFEAVGKYEMAMLDVQTLLAADPSHRDALEIARRLRGPIIGARQEAQQDLQSRPSPAALGASAIRGAPIAGLGPCLPARPVPKKTGPSGSVGVGNNKVDKTYPVPPVEVDPEVKTTQMPKLVLKPSSGSNKSNANGDKDKQNEKAISLKPPATEVAIQWRSLKLVYDHDIRLAQMPVNCSFKVLREIVSKRFPSSNSVLIKYKDDDGDLVTITCTHELRLAESIADGPVLPDKEADIEKSDLYGMLKLHVVEVSPEQEPPLLEEVEVEEEKPVEIEPVEVDNSGSQSNPETDQKTEKEADKPASSEDPELKEVEMDDWLFEFAQLFRTHVGIDPDAHIDLHELGMEMCSEALEETVTSEEAQVLFDKAASKFQEVAALAFFNWGNVHMCAARKRIPIDDSGDQEMVATRLQAAYDWVKEKYTLAREKYEEALSIKPDFYEGLLALGQQQFEMAKLYWSFVVAKKDDLSKWDPTETIQLFDSAEEKMKSATEMWEKLEEQRAKEAKDPNVSKKEEQLKKKSKVNEVSGDEAAEQAAVMKSQIHLFWGNMLFERSQVECKLGLTGWEKNLDTAVERFKLAGASEVDIATVLKNHCSNAEAVEGGDKKVQDST